MSIFSCAFCPTVCLLQRNVYLGLGPIFYWVFCFVLLLNYELFASFGKVNFLHLLEIKPLLIALAANTFSHSID